MRIATTGVIRLVNQEGLMYACCLLSTVKGVGRWSDCEEVRGEGICVADLVRNDCGPSTPEDPG